MPWKGVFGDGCKAAVRGGSLQGVWDLAQDGLQNLRSLPGVWDSGLTDRSRRPYRDANQLAFQVEQFILNVKREPVSWSARKIRERLLLPILRNSYPGNYWKPSGRTGETSVYYDGRGLRESFRESWLTTLF